MNADEKQRSSPLLTHVAYATSPGGRVFYRVPPGKLPTALLIPKVAV